LEGVEKEIGAGEVVEELSEEQRKMNEMMRKLIDANTVLVVKVAACDCRKRSSCKLYTQAQEIAKIILQELRPKT